MCNIEYSSWIIIAFCYWNLNGLTAHDSIKISFLHGYITQDNYDIICLLKTFLNSSIQSNDERFTNNGNNITRSTKICWLEKGGVCIY